MFCGAWVYFNFAKMKKEQVKETKHKKRQFPPGAGGMAGLVGYPTLSFRLQ
jgi:hypothetical protein